MLSIWPGQRLYVSNIQWLTSGNEAKERMYYTINLMYARWLHEFKIEYQIKRFQGTEALEQWS